jgi:hypothetical protein
LPYPSAVRSDQGSRCRQSRSLSLHLVDRPTHHRGNLGIRRVSFEQGRKETYSDAAQASQLQVVGVALRDIADARSGLRVGRIIADGRIEHDRKIGDGSGDRPADVLGTGERVDPPAAGEPLCPADSYQAVVRCRDADRAASVAAHSDGGEIGGNSGTGPAARTARVTVQRIGVAGLTEQRADRGERFVLPTMLMKLCY